MNHRIDRNGPKLLLAAVALAVSGCLSGGGSDDSPAAAAPGPGPGPSNSAPSISGNPPSQVTVGNNYVFTPTALDPDGDTLTYSIENQPLWTDFDPATGALTGTADSGTEGSYADIRITVSDGDLSDSLPAFSIDVTQVALGSASLSWTPPMTNTDGTNLSDLVAYKIYYGVSQGSYPNQIRIDNPGLASYVVENLTPDTYFFVTTAVNSMGVESAYSNVASKLVTANCPLASPPCPDRPIQ